MKKKLGLILVMLFLVPSLALAVDVGNIKFGGEVRMRGYELENFWTFDDGNKFDDWSTYRLRTRLFASADVGENVSGYMRLTNQTYGNNTGVGDNYDNKVLVENAFIDVKSLWGVPFDLRIGRQDLMYGSGFVLFDGQSQFASTSLYFDGVKGTFNFTDNIKLDAFYMIDQENERADEPSDDIYLYGAYLTASDWSIIGGKQEVYAMERKDQIQDKDIKIFGARISDKTEMGIDYSLEGAKQLGTAWNGEDQDAWGGKLDLGFTFNQLESKPRIFGQYAYMTGDDEDTSDYEGWDVFYGGWPQFGDLLAWKFVNIPPNNNSQYDPDFNELASVTGEATYSNLRLATLGVSLVFGSVTPKFSYTKIQLDQTYEAATDDDDFGDYYQGSLGYRYSDALSFAAYYAVIMPGDAFTGKDDAYEFFWEAKVKF